ncbi:MAG TPA: hypothetical protein VN643_00680 [Pyrinomonadaceae bacterium]|nr:hypothetical protein [Pyrinomonadaceae bacterium]
MRDEHIIDLRDEHIIDLIEQNALNEISGADLTRVHSHVKLCASCERAYDAAQVSSALLKEQAAAAFEPSPFFQTRVLAALREHQAANEWSWSRMWRATGALASSMLAGVLAIAVLTFVAPGVSPDAEVSLAGNGYSAEEVILNQNEPAEDQVSDAQVLKSLYESDEER